MGYHYVPQYYLKSFTERLDSPYIWVYEKGSQRVFRAPVSRVAQQTGFYLDDVEVSLANEIERPANRVLEAIRNRHEIDGQQKKVLSHYIAAMLVRVPRHRQRVQRMIPKVTTDVFDKFEADIGTVIESSSREARALGERLVEVKRLRQRWEIQLPEDVQRHAVQPRVSPTLTEVVAAMTWRFLTSDTGPAFLTSDNPVFFYEGYGIAKLRSEVTFPISRDIALWATWRTDLAQGFFPASSQAAKEINRRTISIATRWVFHSRSESWPVDMVNKKKHKLNRLI
jgi:hypothetical protein